VLGLMVGSAGQSGASITLTTPAGLTPGEQFRFVFVTDGTTKASSPTIGDYDSFVQGQAGGATYNGTTVSWLAIGSTSVNAIDHIGSAPVTGVFLVDGTLVTTSTTTTGLWSGTLNNAIDEDISANASLFTVALTGTNADGTNTGAMRWGGQSNNVTIGNIFSTTPSWTNSGFTKRSNEFPLYAISQVLTVVPEPSTLGVGALGAVAFIAYGLVRKRREQRRQAAA
jgi:hypothetical protein